MTSPTQPTREERVTSPQSEEEVLKEFREELRNLCDANIAGDGGAVGTKYVHEIEDLFQEKLHTQATHLREEIRREIEGKKGWITCIHHGENEDPKCLMCAERRAVNVTCDDILALPSLNEGKK